MKSKPTSYMWKINAEIQWQEETEHVTRHTRGTQKKMQFKNLS